MTYGDLFQVMPFQNRLVRISLPGSALREALEQVVGSDHAAAHVSGVELWYDPRHRPGKRISRIRFINGRNLDNHATYTLAVPDFLADGGSGFAMLKSWPRTDTGLVDLDALIAYLNVLPHPVGAPGETRLHAAGR